ncbi:Hypothetical predicted protein [Podarcis lilfordi]|uniref:Uncharacterized protein n=1 Tax=Podarcis lilfordi TaxID=74358 RepID=A0AA35KYA6_9SAUR|nr:Hypothetical predicted protein [Podarcis lilfordi]
MTEVGKIVGGMEKMAREKFFSLKHWNLGTSHIGRFRTEKRKHFFTQYIAKLWNLFPQEAGMATNSEFVEDLLRMATSRDGCAPTEAVIPVAGNHRRTECS